MSSDVQDQLSTGRKPELDGHGLRIAIACSRFNDVITDRLLSGASRRLDELNVASGLVDEVWAPGAFELPLVAKALAESGRYDAVITLGAVVRGGTPHFEYVAGECAAGVLRVGLDTGVPVVFGVLTVDTVEQAAERSVDGAGNKGAEAAETAVEMATILRTIR
jgi:6,7-dimethyl-8-ribityllumazine synthase